MPNWLPQQVGTDIRKDCKCHHQQTGRSLPESPTCLRCPGQSLRPQSFGPSWPGIAGLAAIFPGVGHVIRIRSGSVRSCCSRPKLSGSKISSVASLNGFPPWLTWQRLTRLLSCRPGKGWATTAGLGSCMRRPDRSWRTATVCSPKPYLDCEPCRGLAATPPARSPRLPLTSRSQLSRPIHGGCSPGWRVTTGCCRGRRQMSHSGSSRLS